MKYIKYIVIGILLGIAAAVVVSSYQKNTATKQDVDIVIERIKSVKKLVVTEGYFSEIFSQEEAKEYFPYPFNYSFDKKSTSGLASPFQSCRSGNVLLIRLRRIQSLR
jgi:predicted transcriptional regulator